MRKIMNLTQHIATPTQKEVGVFDLPDELRSELKELHTWENLPTRMEIAERIYHIKEFCEKLHAEFPDVRHAMIGGVPFMNWCWERELKYVDVIPMYAFSRRNTVETPQPDGTVKKTVVFEHLGFVTG